MCIRDSRTPVHTAMIYDDIRGITSPHGIVLRFLFISHTAANEADDNISGTLIFFIFFLVSSNVQSVVLNTNPISRSRLSGNRKIPVFYDQPAFQFDNEMCIRDRFSLHPHGSPYN